MKKVLFILIGSLLAIGLAGCSSDEVENDSNNEIAGCFLVKYHGTSEDYSSVEVIDYPKNAPRIFERKPYLKCPASNFRRKDNTMPSPGDMISIHIKHWESVNHPLFYGLELICDVEYCK